VFCVENLENRLLLSQILVSAYGGNPNDGQDDRGAFEAALNAARAGDTVEFADGTYTFNGTVSLKSGVNVTSVIRAVRRWNSVSRAMGTATRFEPTA
jgi:hypothetical protein